MNATHTPGPWSAAPASKQPTGTLRRDVVSLGGEFSPAFVAGDVLAADAKLIAAAPELLAALSYLVTLAANQDAQATRPGTDIDSHLATARAAITKATTETL